MTPFGTDKKNEDDLDGADDHGGELFASGEAFPVKKSGKKNVFAVLGLMVLGGLFGGYFYLTGMEDQPLSPPVESSLTVEGAPAPAVVLPDVPPATTAATQNIAPPPEDNDAPAVLPSEAKLLPNTIPNTMPTAPSPTGALPTPAGAVPSPVNALPSPDGILPAPAANGNALPPVKTGADSVVAPESMPQQPILPKTAALAEDLPLPPSEDGLLAPVIPPADIAAPAKTSAKTPTKGKNKPAEGQKDKTAPAELAAVPAELAAAPAELAIVQNSTIMDTVGTPAAAAAATPAETKPTEGTLESKGTGPRVMDILSTKADLRPLPEKYLVVKNESSANSTDARLTAGRSALARGNNQAALEIFTELYHKDSHNKSVLMGRAVALQKLGQTAEAVKAYEAALTQDPKNLEALTNMLGLLQSQDRHLAIEKLLDLRDIYPSNAEITAQLGVSYGSAGEYQQALKYLDMAEALRPGSSFVLYNKAIVYDRMGQPSHAADLYRQIISLAADGSLDAQLPIETIKKRLSEIR